MKTVRGQTFNPRPESGAAAPGLEWWVVCAGIVLFAAITCYHTSRVVEQSIAVRGWGPQEYVSHKLHPEQYADDWPNGTLSYDLSLPMQVYYRLARHAGVDPSVTMFPYIFVEALLFAVAAGLLAHTLFQDHRLTALAVVIALCSPMAGLNLARFGAGLGSMLQGLYYGYAYAFRLLAITCFLRNKWMAGFVLLAVTTWCHVTIGLHTCAFIGGLFLLKPRSLLTRRALAGGAVFTILVTPLVLMILQAAMHGSEQISAEDWVTATRMFSAHFYPVSLELFTTRAPYEFVPLVLICLFFLHSLCIAPADGDQRQRQWGVLAGCGACVLLTVVGVCVATWIASPTLIKLGLHRASELLSFFATLFVLRYLYEAVQTRRVATAFLAAYTVVVLVLSKPGLCVGPMVILIGIDVWHGRLGPWMLTGTRALVARWLFGAVAGMLGAFAVLAIICVELKQGSLGQLLTPLYEGLWTPLQMLDPLYRFDFLLRGGRFEGDTGFVLVVASALALLMVVRLPKTVTTRRAEVGQLVGLLVLCSAGVWYRGWVRSTSWLTRYGQTAPAFLEAQRWARAHTEPDALFMIDPSHQYGWRDFSRRSCFGSHREWGYTAFVYASQRELYEEGKRRLRLFGADVDAIARRHEQDRIPLSHAAAVVARTVRDAFAGMREPQFVEIADRYGIDYLVYPIGTYATGPLDFPVAFENDHYVIYRLGGQAGHPATQSSQ